VVGVMVERCKAFRNEGSSEEPIQSFLVNDSDVISNLDTIGVSLGADASSISESVVDLKNSALGSLHERVSVNLKDKVLEKEEKELLEEEELELFLKNIYSEIMEEVMDLGSDCDVVLPRGLTKKKDYRKGKKFKNYKNS
jgi:hypothetical protein